LSGVQRDARAGNHPQGFKISKSQTKPVKKNPDLATQHNERIIGAAETGAPKRFRRLKWNELVTQGDFVSDGHRGFELWEGPTGFRADAFVKPIYRPDRRRLAKKAAMAG